MNGDLFNLPAGPISFAVGAEYRGERFEDTPDSLNTTFQTIGSTDLQSSRVNRDAWGFYQEVRIPVTAQPGISPALTAWSSIWPSARNGTPKMVAASSAIPHESHSQFDTRDRSSRFAGNRLTRNSRCVRATAKGFMLRLCSNCRPRRSELPGGYRSTQSNLC
jgi:hypothetical protein